MIARYSAELPASMIKNQATSSLCGHFVYSDVESSLFTGLSMKTGKNETVLDEGKWNMVYRRGMRCTELVLKAARTLRPMVSSLSADCVMRW
jgi:hypothetical protein